MLVLGWWWWASDEMVKSGLKNGWFKVMTIESGSEKGYGMILGCWWWGGDLQVMSGESNELLPQPSGPGRVRP